MAKKDLTQINTGRFYNSIENATAETQEEQEAQQGRKPRRTYTEQEAQEIMQSLKTSGRKGLKLPRINLAFSPEIYEYIKTMSRVSGQSMTDFINAALQQHLNEHRDIYEKAIEFRNSL